jgi:hypothetical protein
MVASIDIISSDEASVVRQTLFDVRDRWIRRGGEPSQFYSFGAASYMDFGTWAQRFADYTATVNVYNPLLLNLFGDLLERVRAGLEQHLSEPVRFKADAAVPGFHIWLYPSIFTSSNASLHFDLQYRNLNWSAVEAPDFTKTISFTLPIVLPKRGGGLNVWNVTNAEYEKLLTKGMTSSPTDVIRFKKLTYNPYCVGILALHSGHELHQIAAVTEADLDDERITLQGHGVRCATGWEIYW